MTPDEIADHLACRGSACFPFGIDQVRHIISLVAVAEAAERERCAERATTALRGAAKGEGVEQLVSVVTVAITVET